MATTENHAGGVRRIPQRRDTTYQFPVYRWLSWLTIAGYAIGLGCMYLLMGMFGIPAPIGWAALVFLFCVGIALLDRPKTLLTAMMFYFLLMPGNRLFGLLGLPLPGFIDELFFIPFIAVIVMNWIQRSEMPDGLWFPMAFMGVAALSWYVNGKPSPFTTVQVTLIMLKFYIIWYFCRLTCTFDRQGDFWKWGLGYIYYAAAQFLYNCLWQRAPWPRFHPDYSGGVFGPDAKAAHVVGYISVLALYLLAGWWVGPGRKATKRMRFWMLFVGIVIAYDAIFMTDTKHGVMLMPLAFLPFLFHGSIPVRFRMSLLFGGGVFTLAMILFLGSTTGVLQLRKVGQRFVDSPKGDAYLAVTRDFSYLVPYPVLGAGPGRFFSGQAKDAGAPLARRYVIPYEDEAERAHILHQMAARTGSSVLAWPQCGFLTLMGEFGWLGTGAYMAFWAWVFAKLWAKARKGLHKPELAGVYLGLACGVVYLAMLQFINNTESVPCLMFPWWMLIGRIWDISDVQWETGGNAAIEADGGAGEMPASSSLAEE